MNAWQSDWARELARAHAGGVSQTFILHGNVQDLVPTQGGYGMLAEFLGSRMFGRWDLVLHYDLVKGPRPLAGSAERLARMTRRLDRFGAQAEEWRAAREPSRALALLDRFLEAVLLCESERPSVALIFDHAHLLAPEGPAPGRDVAASLATLLNWSKNPYFKKSAFAFCLISERLSDLHESLVRNAHTTKIEVPMPGEDERLSFLSFAAGGRAFSELASVDAGTLSRLTPGLTLVQLQGLVTRAAKTGEPVSLEALSSDKKRMIESQCGGLVEFVEPRRTLSDVAGNAAAKKRLLEDAGLLARGDLSAVPMGYLVCGPVGTGKTFLAECYAGSVGIPCLKLRNFRGKYVGETEGNLEKILRVLKSMGPAAVIIDEADAMLGNREASGDSGTSSRVFGQFAAQMGDTSYRGRIVWFLLTCRPDLLPVDLKRQGRAEVHIPLFGPETESELWDMTRAMAAKNKADLDPAARSALPPGAALSGADVEGVVTRARRLAILSGSRRIAPEHLSRAFAEFIPQRQSDEKELQTLAAILECTDMEFLPASFRPRVETPEGRAALASRFDALRRGFI